MLNTIETVAAFSGLANVKQQETTRHYKPTTPTSNRYPIPFPRGCPISPGYSTSQSTPQSTTEHSASILTDESSPMLSQTPKIQLLSPQKSINLDDILKPSSTQRSSSLSPSLSLSDTETIPPVEDFVKNNFDIIDVGLGKR